MNDPTIIYRHLQPSSIDPATHTKLLGSSVSGVRFPVSGGDATNPKSPPDTGSRTPDTGPRTRWLKMATADIDRAGDELVLEGMDSTNFFKNPQFLWQHGQSGSEISTIGRIRSLSILDGALYALAEYADPDVSDFAEQIFRLDAAGYLPANSIGFRPIEWEKNSLGGNRFLKWELVECSKVELPMNPNAVSNYELQITNYEFKTRGSNAVMSLPDANTWLWEK